MRIRVLKERFAGVFEGAAIIYTRIGATLVSGAAKKDIAGLVNAQRRQRENLRHSQGTVQ